MGIVELVLNSHMLTLLTPMFCHIFVSCSYNLPINSSRSPILHRSSGKAERPERGAPRPPASQCARVSWMLMTGTTGCTVRIGDVLGWAEVT
jgi:hypothetical protein